MNPLDNPHLERQAAKDEALLVNAADMLALKRELAKAEDDRATIYSGLQAVLAENERLLQVEAWAKRAYRLLGNLGYLSLEDTLAVVDVRNDAPETVRVLNTPLSKLIEVYR